MEAAAAATHLLAFPVVPVAEQLTVLSGAKDRVVKKISAMRAFTFPYLCLFGSDGIVVVDYVMLDLAQRKKATSRSSSYGAQVKCDYAPAGIPSMP